MKREAPSTADAVGGTRNSKPRASRSSSSGLLGACGPPLDVIVPSLSKNSSWERTHSGSCNLICG